MRIRDLQAGIARREEERVAREKRKQEIFSSPEPLSCLTDPLDIELSRELMAENAAKVLEFYPDMKAKAEEEALQQYKAASQAAAASFRRNCPEYQASAESFQLMSAFILREELDTRAEITYHKAYAATKHLMKPKQEEYRDYYTKEIIPNYIVDQMSSTEFAERVLGARTEYARSKLRAW